MNDKEAKVIIETLIMGKHPKTGEDISEDSVLRDADVVRALYILLKLTETKAVPEINLETDTNVTIDEQHLYISEENTFKIISRYNISVTKFIQRIIEVTDSPAVQILTPAMFNKWLVNCRYLYEEMDEMGKVRRYPTDEGLNVGLVTDTFTLESGYQVPTIRLSPAAQEYFLKKLDEIISPHISSSISIKRKKESRKRDEQSLPFEITEQQICEIISEEEVGIAQFVRKINSVIQNDKMCIPSSNEMLLWMESVGILVFVDIGNSRRRREPTELGKSYGIILKNQVKDNGEEYIQTLYTKKAQIFLLSSIPEILEMRE